MPAFILRRYTDYPDGASRYVSRVDDLGAGRTRMQYTRLIHEARRFPTAAAARAAQEYSTFAFHVVPVDDVPGATPPAPEQQPSAALDALLNQRNGGEGSTTVRERARIHSGCSTTAPLIEQLRGYRDYLVNLDSRSDIGDRNLAAVEAALALMEPSEAVEQRDPNTSIASFITVPREYTSTDWPDWLPPITEHGTWGGHPYTGTTRRTYDNGWVSNGIEPAAYLRHVTTFHRGARFTSPDDLAWRVVGDQAIHPLAPPAPGSFRPAPGSFRALLRTPTPSEARVMFDRRGTAYNLARCRDLRFPVELNAILASTRVGATLPSSSPSETLARLDALAARYNSRTQRLLAVFAPKGRAPRGFEPGSTPAYWVVVRSDCGHYSFKHQQRQVQPDDSTACKNCYLAVTLLRLQPNGTPASLVANIRRNYADPRLARCPSCGTHWRVAEGDALGCISFPVPRCPDCKHQEIASVPADIIGYHALQAEAVLPWRPMPACADDMQRPYIGVELEVECYADGTRLGDRVAACRNTHALLKGYVLTSRDGSLSNGFEIVSAPMLLAEHYRAPWSRYFRERDANLDPGAHDGAGLHVNLNRASLTPTQAARLVTLVHNHPGTFRKYARRSADSWCKFTRKEEATALQDSQKFSAVNVSKAPVFEFRLFRSTLNELFFFGSLELVAALREYAIAAGNAPLTVARFHEYALDARAAFPALHDYAAHLGIEGFQGAKRLTELQNDPNVF